MIKNSFKRVSIGDALGLADRDRKKVSVQDFIKISPKQSIVLDYIGEGYFVFYGGGRGSGKSHLMRSSAILACLKYPGLQACIIRESFPELEKNFIRPFLRDVPGELYNYTQQKKSATFFNGSVLDFIGVNKLRDIEKIKGIEYGLMCVDEGNNLDWEILNGIRGSNRSMVARSFKPTMLVTGNPGGIADQQIKDYFVRPDYTKWTAEELEQKDRYVYVHATVYDNPDEEFVSSYVRQLKTMPPHRRRQWLDGDWESFSGQFFEEWDNEVHVVPPFEIPAHWERYCGLDLGRGKHPSVCLWAAQDPETEDVFIYREFFTKEPTQQFCLMVANYSNGDFISRYAADTNFWENPRADYDSESPAFMFLREGIVLEPAPKNRGVGWSIVKQWLHFNSGIEDDAIGAKAIPSPKLRFFSTCIRTIESIPRLKYNHLGNDLDTDMDDDAADALRYLLVSCLRYPYSDQETIEKQDSMLSSKQKLHLSRASSSDGLVSKGSSARPKETFATMRQQTKWATY